MAISFVGSSVSGFMELAYDAYVFIIENTQFSRSLVKIRRLSAQVDNIGYISASGYYMPIFRALKVTGEASGGIVLPKASFDTLNYVSDSGIVIRQAILPFPDPSIALAVTGTPESYSWGQFTAKRLTGVEQAIADDQNILPLIVGNQDWVIRPGQILAVQVKHGTATGTQATQSTFFVEAVWEEDNTLDAGYTLSGDVTLSGSPVTGAKVVLVTDLDADFPNPKIEVINTSTGAWSKTLASNVKASAFVQHQSGGTKYTDEGNPYMEKP